MALKNILLTFLLISIALVSSKEYDPTHGRFSKQCGPDSVLLAFNPPENHTVTFTIPTFDLPKEKRVTECQKFFDVNEIAELEVNFKNCTGLDTRHLSLNILVYRAGDMDPYFYNLEVDC